MTNRRDHSGLGRLVAEDPRDKKYLLSRPADDDFRMLATERPYQHWKVGPVLNQGNTPHCVEYAGRQWLTASPVRQALDMPFGDLYRECQRLDEWDGEDYDGTSVRALYKSFKLRGYCSEYRWTWDNLTMVSWLLTEGPLVVGTDWLDGMDRPNRDGFVRAAGSNWGGHAYLICGTNTRKACPDGSIGAHRLINSWGTIWGQNGYAWISYPDMQKLLDSWGECATAPELKGEPIKTSE